MTPRRPGSGTTAALVSMVLLTAVLVAQQKPATQKMPPASVATSPDALLGQALHEEEVEGRLQNAIATYQKVLKAPGVTRAQAARAQFRIGACYERLGLAEARKAYESVVANYADQTDLAAEAKARLAALAAPATPSGGPVVRQIWATSGGMEQGRISPDGRSVVGVDEETGDLLIRSVATGEIRRLTAISKDRWWMDYAASPIWSRDGRQIAYKWEVWTSGSPGRVATHSVATEFRIADVADGTSRVVPLDARFRLDALEDWFYDGRRVLARVEDALPENRRQHLAWVPTGGGTVELLASAGTGQDLDRAFLAPDGAWIVTRIPKDDTGFSIVAARGEPARTLIPAAVSDALIGWSADGTHVLFVSREGGSNDLMAVRVADGQAVDRPFFIRTLPVFSSLGVSQAGALLFQSTQEGRSILYRASFDATSGRVGTPSRVDVSTGYSNGSVSWSPDGRRLAYVSWPDGKPARTLSVWSAENAQTRTYSLPFNAARWGWRTTTWSADGRAVYAGGVDDAGRQGVYRINTDNGTVEAVLPSSSNLFPIGETRNPYTSLAAWSPDARIVYKNELYFLSTFARLADGATAAIIEHRLADHAERELFKTRPSVAKLGVVDVSPDGVQLAFWVLDYTARKLTVMTMPAAGGPAKTVAELSTTAEGVVRWTPDGRSIVFTSRSNPPQERLLCNVAAGVVTKLTLPSERVEEVAVSPDGREIAYIGGYRGDQGVWMLENFLPKPKSTAPALKK